MTSYILRKDLVQGSPEWHQWRKGKIGASSVAPILGLSPYTTKLQCWEAFKFDIKKQKTEAMQRGNDLEERARMALNDRFKGQFHFDPVCVESAMYPWMIASLDGFDELAYMACEIKCPGRRDHYTAQMGFVPEHYMPQLQHIMYMLNLPMMVYWSFDGENGVEVICERDDEFIKRMIQEEVAFMESLRDFMPPEPCEADWIEDIDPKRVQASRMYRELQDKEDDIQLEKLRLKEILTSVPHPRAKIGNMRVQKVRRKGNVDYSQIAELKGIDLENYRKPASESWRIY